MSDVIERLKKSMDDALPPHFDDVEDAVDEIDRLRIDKEFLIRLIRGEGSKDMIETMEVFLGERDA